jgi:hypothetical protein
MAGPSVQVALVILSSRGHEIFTGGGELNKQTPIRAFAATKDLPLHRLARSSRRGMTRKALAGAVRVTSSAGAAPVVI